MVRPVLTFVTMASRARLRAKGGRVCRRTDGNLGRGLPSKERSFEETVRSRYINITIPVLVPYVQFLIRFDQLQVAGVQSGNFWIIV